jgi:hypothetical protein
LGEIGIPADFRDRDLPGLEKPGSGPGSPGSSVTGIGIGISRFQ